MSRISYNGLASNLPNGAKHIILNALFTTVCKGFSAVFDAVPHTIIPYLTYECTKAWYTSRKVSRSTQFLIFAIEPQALDIF